MHMLIRSYLLDKEWAVPLYRYQASRDDLAVYSALSSAPTSSNIHALRWYKHITALLGARYVYSAKPKLTANKFAIIPKNIWSAYILTAPEV